VSALRALIFDVDGTLAETERHGHRIAFNSAFKEADLDWHWDEVLYGALLKIAGGPERIAHYARTYGGSQHTDAELQALVERLHASKTREYVALVAAGTVHLRPGVARIIAEARAQNILLAIATTTTRANVTALIEATLGSAALSWFAAMGTAQEVAAKKPDPAVYRWVLERLGIEAAEALALEDSRNGLLAALRAGVPCVVTPTPYSADEDFSEALVRLDDLDHHPQPAGHAVSIEDLRRWHSSALAATGTEAVDAPVSRTPSPV
jgi:HAD superfamily hydrolase (TIGR01509 family)